MDTRQVPDIPSPESAVDRLDSWKEIAVHLRRDVRTVQRWHRRAGLPVHRHADPKQRGVFAYRSEVDAWANQSRATTEADADTGDDRPDRVGRLSARFWLTVGILACAAVVLVIGLVRSGRAGSMPFAKGDWVLVADIENHSGDSLLDSALEYALERELAEPGQVNIVPRERIQDVLRLMRRPADTVLTPPTATEVARRDGDIQAILSGRIDSLAPGYLLTIDLVDPRGGTTFRSRSERMGSRADVLQHVHTLAAWARATLGDRSPLPRPGDRPPRVTTASWSALQSYARAQDALARDERSAARLLLESAVRDDPEFAMAHMWLAFILVNQPDGGLLSTAATFHLERAVALSNLAGERERLFIVAESRGRHGNLAGAIAAYEALAKLDPDDWRTHGSLAGYYNAAQRFPESLREVERTVELRPHDLRSAVWAAQQWSLRDPDRARMYADRARTLLPGQHPVYSSELPRMNLPPHHAREAAWILLFPAYDYWRKGDIRAMLAEVQRVLAADPLPGPADRDALLTVGISFNMTAGRLRDARGLVGRMFQERVRELHLAVLADAVDDFAALREHMSRVPPEGETRALRFVRAGLTAQAESVLQRIRSHDGFREAAEGELLLRGGKLEEAVQKLRLSIELAHDRPLSERYLAAESLATALSRLGRRDEAIEVLEAGVAHEAGYNFTGPSGAFWLRVLNRLSRAYRETGRLDKAEAVDARLRRLLGFADPNHPIVLELATRASH